MSVLRKDMIPIVHLGTPMVQGRPGQPATPGYWIVVREPVTVYIYPDGSWEKVTGGSGVGNSAEEKNNSSPLTPPLFPPDYIEKKTIYIERRTWVPPYPAIPAVPYKPATPTVIEWQYNAGWNNAYAISIGQVPLESGVEYKIPTGVSGVFVGLALASAYGSTVSFFTHGVLAQVDGIFIYEHGQKKERLTNGINIVYTVQIIRSGSKVVYQVFNGNSLVACALHDTALPDEGPVHAFGYMYRGGDEIRDARIFALTGQTHGPAPPVVLNAGLSLMAVPLPPGASSACLLEVSGPILQVRRSTACMTFGLRLENVNTYRAGRGRLRLPKLNARLADHDFCEINATLPSLTSFLEVAHIPPRRQTIDLTFPPLACRSRLLKSASGHIKAILSPVAAQLADHPFGILSGSIPYLGALLYQDLFPNMGFILSRARLRHTVQSIIDHVVVFDSTGRLIDSFSVHKEQVEELLATLHLTHTVQAVSSFFVEFQSLLRGVLHLGCTVLRPGPGPGGQSEDLPGVEQGGRVWVVNVETGASWQYDGYGFNSFFTHNGRHYGVADDGVYLLEGDSDAGWPVNAYIDFGVSTLGTPQRKRVVAVYAGVTSTGQLLLKTDVDGSSHVYAARSFSAGARKHHRFDLGRGLAGTHWRFELLTKDGCDFDLESVVFEPITLARKI